MFVCEKRKGIHTFKVGFATLEKALAWFDENQTHFYRVRSIGKLDEDVEIRVDEVKGQDVTNLKVCWIQHNKIDSSSTKVGVKFNMHELCALKSCVKLMRLMIEKELKIVDEYNCNRLIETIDKALGNYENN